MTIGIIGYGRFGKLWAKMMTRFGAVFVHARNGEDDGGANIKFVSLAQVVQVGILFVVVPISEFEKICQEIAPLVPSGTIIVDVCSVKVYPSRVMQAVFSKDQPLLATHPLFGPDSVIRLGLSGRKIVFCPLHASAEQKKTVRDIFEKLQLVVIETTPDNHDRQMARSQALVHVLGRAIADLELESQEISTPDYESLLRINSMVNNDTWQLFYDMQVYNPYTPLMRLTLRQTLDDIEERIREAGESKAPDDGTFFLWRSMIEQLDHEIIRLIHHRLIVGKRVQEYKKMHNLPVTDPDRERELERSYGEWIEEAGIDDATAVKDILHTIIREVKK